MAQGAERHPIAEEISDASKPSRRRMVLRFAAVLLALAGGASTSASTADFFKLGDHQSSVKRDINEFIDSSSGEEMDVAKEQLFTAYKEGNSKDLEEVYATIGKDSADEELYNMVLDADGSNGRFNKDLIIFIGSLLGGIGGGSILYISNREPQSSKPTAISKSQQ